jgi:hypothetical protein
VVAVETASDAAPSLRARLRDLSWGVATETTAQALAATAPLLARALRAVFGDAPPP